MAEPSRAERMYRDADRAEGRYRPLGDVGVGLRAHLNAEGQPDWRAEHEAEHSEPTPTGSLDLRLTTLAYGFAPGPARRATDSLNHILRITRQVRAAYADIPGVMQAMADIEAEIARVPE